MSSRGFVDVRAARHAALGDPTRLTIVDELVVSDRAPRELQQLTGIASNLLAHHLDVLETVGVITRSRSSGDGRRRYVHLRHEALTELAPGQSLPPQPALFVCTHNSARSQLAAALWTQITEQRADSAGTHPAGRVHPGAIAAGRRAGIDISNRRPRRLGEVGKHPDLVITVCDRAHEELEPHVDWLHWSIADPVADGSRRAFDAALTELRGRIAEVVGAGS